MLKGGERARSIGETLAETWIGESHSGGDSGERNEPFGVGVAKVTGAGPELFLVIDQTAADESQIGC